MFQLRELLVAAPSSVVQGNKAAIQIPPIALLVLKRFSRAARHIIPVGEVMRCESMKLMLVGTQIRVASEKHNRFIDRLY